MTSRDSLAGMLGPGRTWGIEAEEVLARLRRGMFATSAAPPRIGRYGDLELVGRGGMGVVYCARDRELGRRVALKLWRVESVGDRRRLRREAQLMARLSHPNVVQVLDFGLHRGEAFLVMEFVQGQDATAWLSTNSPSQSQILDVFLAAGQGLAAAHAAGIVHRDFKPGNVLVGADGRVRVTDFGLATFGAHHGGGPAAPEPTIRTETLTATGARLGTPRYMAPEQHRDGTANERADQWSFAAALWESLCGEHPFVDGQGQQHPNGGFPVRTNRALPWRIAQGLRRALHRNPSRRYASLDELLAVLEDRDRARRTKRRALAVAGLTLALTGFASSTAGADAPCDAEALLAPTWNRARKNRLANAFASSKLPFGERGWELVETRVDAWAVRWRSTYQGACSLSTIETDQTVVCLQGARRELDVLLEVLSTPDPQLVLRSENAVAALPDPVECGPGARPSFALSQLDPDHVERMAAVRAHGHAGRYADAARLASAATASGDAPPAVLAEANLELGVNLMSGGSPGEGLAPLREAYYAAAAEKRADLAARAATQLLRASTKMAESQAGEQWARHAEAWVRTMDPAADSTHDARRQLAIARADAWMQQGEHDLAEGALGDAWAACGSDPAHPQAPAVLNAMGLLAIERGDYAAAVTVLNRAVGSAETRWGVDHPQTAHAINNLGNAHYHLDEFDHAAAAYRRAYDVRRSTLGPQHALTAMSTMNLGIVADARGDHVEALEWLRESVELYTDALGPDHPRTADAVANLASTLAHAGQPEESSRESRRALESYVAHFGDNHPRIATQRENLAITLADLDRFEDALQEHTLALEVAEETLGEDHPTRAWILHGMAYAKRQLGDREGARDADATAIAIYEKALGPMHPALSSVLVSLASDALTDHRFQDAAALSTRARKLGSLSPATRGLAVLYLVQARRGLGDSGPLQHLLDEAQTELEAAGQRAAEDLEELERLRSSSH